MIEIFAHRAIYQNKENTLEGIENNLKSGFNIEIDVRKNNSGIYLSHDPKIEGEDFFENACNIIKNYNKKVAIHVKEDFDIQEIIDMILEHNIGKKCFLFTTSKKNIQTDDIEIAIYQNNHKMSRNTKTLWCDESCEKWYNYELFAKNQKNGTTIITMSRELYIKSNFEEIKLEWERLHELQTDGICTDFPNELKKFVDG